MIGLFEPLPKSTGNWADVWKKVAMEHLMIDLETMGTRPGCPVLSIGAVYFDPKMGELGESYYGVAYSDQSAYGLKPEKETVDWWARQSAEAQKVFEDPKRIFLPEMLWEFDNFILNKKDTKVWGNGANFDNPVLAAAYHATGKALPWSFWNDRCYRTVKNLAPHVKLVRQGEHHNALDDARSQAMHLMDIVQNTTLTLA